MSDFDDYGDEMPSVPPLDESAVEALLAGRTSAAATGDMGLVAFVEDLRTAVDGPVPEPTPQLAAFLAEGLSTEKGELPATAARNVPGPAVPQAAGLPKWRKRTMTVSGFLAALGAKLAGMGLAAKAALGLGVAAMATTAGAAAGVLPDPAQHAVASVVNAVSPFDVPDGGSTDGVAADEGDGEGDGETTTTSSSTTTVPGGDDGTDGETGVVANHGACVSEAAKSAPRGPGGQHGKAVSEVAKSDCGKSGGDDDGDDDTTTTSSPTTTTPDGDDGDDDELTSGVSNSGKGNGNGGNGNRGPGGGNSGSGGGNSGSGNSGSGKGNGR